MTTGGRCIWVERGGGGPTYQSVVLGFGHYCLVAQRYVDETGVVPSRWLCQRVARSPHYHADQLDPGDVVVRSEKPITVSADNTLCDRFFYVIERIQLAPVDHIRECGTAEIRHFLIVVAQG